MPFTIPPSNKIAGQSGFITDIDNTYDALSQVAGVNVCSSAYAGGADSTGTGACDSAVAAAVAALPASGGAVLFPPGTYKITSGITVTSPGVYLHAIVPGTVTINYTGSGDCIRMYSTTLTTPGGVYGGGVTGGIIIDGTSASAGASGIHAGDIFRMRWDCTVRNFQGTGSKGFWFDHNYHWGEQWQGTIFAETCTTHVLFDNSANTSGVATGSFDRARLDIFADGKGKGDLVKFANGACIHNGNVGMYGNTDYGTSLFYALTLTGSNASGYSRLVNSILNIGFECNGTTGTQPGSINFGSTANNVITGCTGVIDFSASNAFAAPANYLQSLQFDGPVLGATLFRSHLAGVNTYQFGALASGNTILTKYLAKIKVTTTTDVTGVILQGFAPDTDRLITVENKGTGKITFDVAATSHVAGGSSDVIQPNTAAMYTWDVADTLWYRVGPPALSATPDISLLLAPSGALAETHPRGLNGQYTAVLTSGTVYVSAIALPAGLTVTSLATIIGSTAFSGVTHGWYALLDSGRVVRAVTADQTSSFGSGSTALSLAAGTPYVIPAAGFYYLAVCVVASTMGTLPLGNSPLSGSNSAAPILAGTSSTGQTTPPSTGTTLAAVSADGSKKFYGYTS